MSDMENLEAPGTTSGGLPRPADKFDRPGYEIFVPGACLKIGSKMWDQDHRKDGVWLRMVYLTASEEIEALNEAQRAGAMVVAQTFTARKSVVAIASAKAPDDDGVRGMGEWKRVPKLDAPAVWEELGFQGRNIAYQAFNLANSASEENREAALKSFRVVG
jgi:hypothetical protein